MAGGCQPLRSCCSCCCCCASESGRWKRALLWHPFPQVRVDGVQLWKRGREVRTTAAALRPAQRAITIPAAEVSDMHLLPRNSQLPVPKSSIVHASLVVWGHKGKLLEITETLVCFAVPKTSFRRYCCLCIPGTLGYDAIFVSARPHPPLPA